MSAISLQDVTKLWGSARAVDGVSFEAAAGRFLVLLGPSGCGKSTTLRLIAGLEQVSSGRVKIGDADVTGLPPAQRRISMVFQSYALFPHLSVAENIVFGLRVRDVPVSERAARLAKVAALLGLDDAARAQAVAALGRAAAARRAGSRDHRRDAGVPDGRAAVQPRRAVAAGNAPRDPRIAAEAGHYHGVRHP